MSLKITYDNKDIATIEYGYRATLPVSNKRLIDDIVISTTKIQTYDGTGVVAGSISELIFTINSITYSFVPLMTWYDWANSPYNTAGFICPSKNDMVADSENINYILDINGTAVYGNQLINSHASYTLGDI